MRKLTTEEFISKAKAIHGNKYQYFKTVYDKNDKLLCIVCPQHGEFWLSANNHLNGEGCVKCRNVNTSLRCRRKQIDVINGFKAGHGNKYDYSKVLYVGGKTAVCIICPTHGKFYQRPTHHSSGCGCPQCASDKRKMTKSEFEVRAKEVHGEMYEYSNVMISDSKTKVKISCPRHGIFMQAPSEHLSGRGCKKCFNEDRSRRMRSDVIEFSNKANIIHDNKYDYSKVIYYGSRRKVQILCPIHGVFEQTPTAHCQGAGCPACSSSSGELRIIKKLKGWGVGFCHQHSFNDCKYHRKLIFDFYIPSKNLLIEYDGEQHSRPIDIFGGDAGFRKTQDRDRIKNNYATNKGIRLIRIPYTKFNDIEKILTEALRPTLSCISDTALGNQQ